MGIGCCIVTLFIVVDIYCCNKSLANQCYFSYLCRDGYVGVVPCYHCHLVRIYTVSHLYILLNTIYMKSVFILLVAVTTVSVYSNIHAGWVQVL